MRVLSFPSADQGQKEKNDFKRQVNGSKTRGAVRALEEMQLSGEWEQEREEAGEREWEK